MPGKRKPIVTYSLIVLGSLIAGATGAEIYLSYRAPRRLPIPFYNVLYPYVMFRPPENANFVSDETYAMSHFKSRVYVYTNADGFRVPAPGYRLPKAKPEGQLRIAFLGGSLVQLASTFDSALPGALRKLLRQRYPGRDIEVINAGIQSCISRQSIAQLLFTVVDYHPDVVILYDGGNDLGMPLVYESRPNFPYNFQSMQDAWDIYRAEREQPVWRMLLERSNIYRLIRGRLDPGERKMTPESDAPFAGTNALPAGRILADPEYIREHVAAYLSNWHKLIELSAAYHYQTICVLSPVGSFESEEEVGVLRQTFHLDRSSAFEWLRAAKEMYGEAVRQIGAMRGQFPQAILLDLSAFLKPPGKYFCDADHVYDEVNDLLAQKIYTDARPAIETALREVR